MDNLKASHLRDEHADLATADDLQSLRETLASLSGEVLRFTQMLDGGLRQDLERIPAT